MATEEPYDEDSKAGVSRREFLSTTGLGVVGLAAMRVDQEDPALETNVVDAADRIAVTLNINGREHRLLVEARWSLAFVLREQLGLTGTKLGCGRGECGSCTVLANDETRYACLTLAVEAQDWEITTVEGLLDGEDLGDVQQAFAETDAYQCGYCTPGQIMSVEGLLRATPDPTLDEIRVGVSGNLCRCGAYPNIFKAAKRAGELKRGEG